MSEENLPHAVLLAVHQITEDKWQAMVSAQHQTIGFGPLCESEEECQWWCSQFKAAMTRVGARFMDVDLVQSQNLERIKEKRKALREMKRNVKRRLHGKHSWGDLHAKDAIKTAEAEIQTLLKS